MGQFWSRLGKCLVILFFLGIFGLWVWKMVTIVNRSTYLSVDETIKTYWFSSPERIMGIAVKKPLPKPENGQNTMMIVGAMSDEALSQYIVSPAILNDSGWQLTSVATNIGFDPGELYERAKRGDIAPTRLFGLEIDCSRLDPGEQYWIEWRFLPLDGEHASEFELYQFNFDDFFQQLH